MKRLLLCTACIASMLTVAVAVVMALGVEWVQRKKGKPDAPQVPPRVLRWDSAHPPDDEWLIRVRGDWQEAMSQ